MAKWFMDEKNQAVNEWLRLAKGDPELAAPGIESGILPGLLCFNAQQCAEIFYSGTESGDPPDCL